MHFPCFFPPPLVAAFCCVVSRLSNARNFRETIEFLEAKLHDCFEGEITDIDKSPDIVDDMAVAQQRIYVLRSSLSFVYGSSSELVNIYCSRHNNMRGSLDI